MSSETCGITPGTVRAGCVTDDSSTDGTVEAAQPAVFFNRILLALALFVLLPVLTNPAFAEIPLPYSGFTPASNDIAMTIEGCRNDGNPSITPTDTLPGPDGRWVCSDPAPLGGNDNPYTTGNLGKGWNELDLVPFRLTLVNSGEDEETYRAP